MDREPDPVGQMGEHPVRDKSHLERRAVVDQAGDVARPARRHRLQGRARTRRADARPRRGDRSGRADAALSSHAWHGGIDLGDHRRHARVAGHVDRDAEAAHTLLVRRGDLYQGDVEPGAGRCGRGAARPPARRGRTPPVRVEQRSDVSADVEHAVPVRGPRGIADPDAVCERVDEHDAVRRRVTQLQRLQQRVRGVPQAHGPNTWSPGLIRPTASSAEICRSPSSPVELVATTLHVRGILILHSCAADRSDCRSGWLVSGKVARVRRRTRGEKR